MRELDHLRRELARHGLSDDQLDELADHAASDSERRIAAGVEPAEAVRAACEALGSASLLSREYRKLHVMPQPSRLIAVFASLAIVAAVAAPPHEALSLLDLPSLLLVGGFLIAGLFSSFGPAQTLATLRECLLARNSAVMAPLVRELHLAVVRRAYRLAWVGGGLGALAGVIRTLMNLSDPSELGVAAALGLLSVLYGALLAEVVFANAAQWLAPPAESRAS